MGYDQYLSLWISKKCKGKDEAIAFLSTVEKRVCDALETEREHFDTFVCHHRRNAAALECSLNGRNLYDGGVLGMNGESCQPLSGELGCRVEVSYQGEENDDTEIAAFENGKCIELWRPVMVNEKAAEVVELDKILRRVRERSPDEASLIKHLFLRLLAKVVVEKE